METIKSFDEQTVYYRRGKITIRIIKRNSLEVGNYLCITMSNDGWDDSITPIRLDSKYMNKYSLESIAYRLLDIYDEGNITLAKIYVINGLGETPDKWTVDIEEDV